MQKKLFNSALTLLCFILSFSIGYSAQIETPNDSYQQGEILALNLKQKDIPGTQQKYSLTSIYKGLEDKINNTLDKSLSNQEKSKTSFSIGYNTGVASLNSGVLFSPKPESISYNSSQVINGITDHYKNNTPKYELLSDNELREILEQNPKTLPPKISNDQYSYSLGYNLFVIPREYILSGLIDINAFIDGLWAGHKNQTYSLTKQQANKVSYITGYLIYNPDNQSQKQFLKGFYDQIHINI